MRNLYEYFFLKKESRQNMTSNSNAYYNFLEYFKKKHLGFAEHSLRNIAIKYIKHKQI